MDVKIDKLINKLINQPNTNIKNVTSNWGRDCHISETLPSYDYTEILSIYISSRSPIRLPGNQIGNTCTCGQNGQTNNLKSSFILTKPLLIWFLTSVGITKVSPMVLAHHTIKYENDAIQKIEPMNVKTYHRRHSSFRTSGIVIQSGNRIGHKKRYINCLFQRSGHVISRGFSSSSSRMDF